MMTAQPILLIEDEHALGTALSILVRRMGHLPTLVASGAAGLAELDRAGYAAVVLDIGLPDMSGLQVLERIRRGGPNPPVLVITAHATLDHAIHAQKSGATGYLTKPLDLRQFEQTLGALLAPAAPPAEPPPAATPSAAFIGTAPCLRDAFVGIARACAGDVPALITGATGTGKSLVARVIHTHGTRADQPLEFLAASAISDPEALDHHPKGTVVLEEITDIPAPVQMKLAAWLGTQGRHRPRVLATTAPDPLTAVREGLLREDLYYALATLTIPLPPLRERSGDIPALTAYFTGLRRDRPPSVLTPPVLAAFAAYPWPGNVRELRHVLEYAVTMSAGGPVFLSHLPGQVAATGTEAAAGGELETVLGRWLDAALALPEESRPAYDTLLDRLEAVMLHHLLERHDHKPTHLATAMRLNRATLRQKLRRTGLQRGDD